MAGYRDWVSQGASSSAAPSFPIPAPIPDPEELEFMSQGPSRARAAPSLSAGRVNMQDLDLNSQDESFPYLDEYTDILEFGRGRGDGVQIGSFQPPRQTDGGVPIGRGRGGTARGGRRGRGRRGTASPSPPSDASPPIRQHLRGRLGRGATSAAYSTSMNTEDVEQLDEESGEDHHNKCHRANWSELNTGIFCELAVEQIRIGNATGGVVNSRGFKEIAAKFAERTTIRHEPKQFRNRWDQCKKLYEFYVFAMKQSGLGRKNNGAISASKAWWDKYCKYPECRKFSKFLPHYLELLYEMYHKNVVDGSTTTIPGDVDEDRQEVPEEDDFQFDVEDYPEQSPMSPMSNGSKKRSTSTNDTASSPQKKSKSPFFKMFKGLIDTMHEGISEDNTTMRVKMELQLKQREMELQQQLKQKELELEFRRHSHDKEEDEFRASLLLAQECGASEESEEYFFAMELFRDRLNRVAFGTLSTKEARFKWLQTKCGKTFGRP
ncbi:L10-interacting MYB domain-containing protein-like [Setaria italica]|uniref:L10-interacting MYB domain-containing protein-like n=1 Tax=Setaria italica TaxID=4555 RepID=UPI00064711B2|nr:L10-interacting MYB domain-containing protein-like [Setaria italica]